MTDASLRQLRPRVWVTRTQPSADASAKRWAEAGFDPVVAPLLTVSPVDDFAPISKHAAIIFTSANGVRYSAIKGDDRPVYAVGDATAKAAKIAGFRDVKASGGNWKTLVQLIEKKHKSIIHISGSHIRGRIVEHLRSVGHKAERRIVYRTDPVDAWSLDPCQIDAAALYSPMAAQTLLALPPRPLEHVTALCFSEAVAAPLRSSSRQVQAIYVATKPTQSALLACSRALRD